MLKSKIFRGNNKIKFNSKNSLEFQIVDVYSEDYEPEDLENSSDSESGSDDERGSRNKYIDKKKFRITLFGITEEGESVCLYVDNFPAYGYVEIPDNWKKYHINKFIETLKSKVPFRFKQALKDFNLVKRMKFKGFTNYKFFKFIRLVFDNKTARQVYLKQFEKPFTISSIPGCRKHIFECWDIIDPMLRFFHVKDIQASGWVKIEKGKFMIENNTEYKKTYCQIEATTDWNNVNHIEREEIAPIIQARYDIEADSSHGDFPIAKKDYKKLVSDIVNYYTTQNRQIRNYKKEIGNLNTMGSSGNGNGNGGKNSKEEIEKKKMN